MSRFLIVATGLAATLMLVPGTAFADNPCSDDIKEYCGDVDPGEGRIEACLRENRKKLSKECKAHRRAVAKALGKAAKDCAEDYQAHCADVEPGEGRVLACMTKNKDQFSDKCQAQMDKGKKKVKKAFKNWKKYCADDQKKLCKGVKPGKGRILTCLKDSADDVSDDCKEHLGL